MCDVQAFVKVLGIGVSAAAQSSNARRTAVAARAAEGDALTGQYERMHQEDQAATDQMVDRSRAAVREVGALNAIFADSGLSGNSQDRVIANAEGNAAADITTIARNRDNRASQGAAEIAAIHAKTQDRINATPRPSLIGTGLQIVGVEADRRARDTAKRAS